MVLLEPASAFELRFLGAFALSSLRKESRERQLVLAHADVGVLALHVLLESLEFPEDDPDRVHGRYGSQPVEQRHRYFEADSAAPTAA